MRLLAVTRFTLLRLLRSRYPLAAVALVGLVLLVFLYSESGANAGLPLAQGLAWVITWLSAIWLGLNVVQADRDDGALRSTLTRPISLVEVLIGKLLGAFVYLALLAFFFTAVINLAMLIMGASPDRHSLIYQVHLLPVHGTVLALSMLLAQIMPRFLAGLVALFAWDQWLLNKAAEMTASLSPAFTDLFQGAAKLIYLLLPPTTKFYLSYGEFAFHDLPATTYLLLLPYAAHYILAACLLAAWALNRQEL